MDHKTLTEIAREIYTNNVEHGWFDKPREFGDDVALLHSEVSEMYEAWRKDIVDGPSSLSSEAADILIRLLDTCTRHGIDLELAYERKMLYNREREYRHGGSKV